MRIIISPILIDTRDTNLVVKQFYSCKEIVIEPATEPYFYKDQSYSLKVIKDEDGKPMQVLVPGIDLINEVKD